MVIYRRWKKTKLLESLVSVLGIFFFFQWLCQSRSNPPVVIVLPSPKKGTSQLEWTKVHRCVGEGRVWVLVRVEVKTSARSRCTRIALPVPSRVLLPCTPFSVSQRPSLILMPLLRFWSCFRLHNHPEVQLKDLVHAVVMPATLPQTNTTQCPYGRSALANPTHLMWEQKIKRTNKKK